MNSYTKITKQLGLQEQKTKQTGAPPAEGLGKMACSTLTVPAQCPLSARYSARSVPAIKKQEIRECFERE